MSKRLKEKEEKILQIIEKLCEESTNGTPIVVEGKKDITTLRALGVDGPILSMKTGGKSLVDFLHEIECTRSPEIILLLDFDRKGREATIRLKKNLEIAKIKPNAQIWQDLLNLLRKDIQSIESLTAYLGTLRKKTIQ